jgi:hypothetical protein
MPFSVRLTREDEKLLETAARRTSEPKGELVRRGIRELCLKLLGPSRLSPYEAGQGLFGAGKLTTREPKDPLKRAIKEKLRAKHRLD